MAITRLLPADLYEAIQEFGASKTLEEVTVLMQDGKTYDCQNCTEKIGDTTVSTGWVTITVDEEEVKIICPVCMGYRKTELEYEEVCTNKELIPIYPDEEEE